jgi:hypothetical protein
MVKGLDPVNLNEWAATVAGRSDDGMWVYRPTPGRV